MRDKKYQNRVAESVLTLPACAALTVLLWWWPKGSPVWEQAICLFFCAVVSGMLWGTDNHCGFVRIRSQLTICYWLLCVAIMGFFHADVVVAATCTSFTLGFYSLFYTYQQPRAVGMVYNSFLFLALGSLAYPHMMYLALCFWWYMIVFMRCMSVRTFFASLLGLATPFWFWTGWCVWTEDFAPMLHHAVAFVSVDLPARELYISLSPVWIFSWVMVTLLSFLSGIHYLRYCYDDSISVRMYLYMCLFQCFVLTVLSVLQVSFIRFLLPMSVVCGAPLVSHYFSLTRSRFTNILFIATQFLFALLAVLSIWMPS